MYRNHKKEKKKKKKEKERKRKKIEFESGAEGRPSNDSAWILIRD